MNINDEDYKLTPEAKDALRELQTFHKSISPTKGVVDAELDNLAIELQLNKLQSLWLAGKVESLLKAQLASLIAETKHVIYINGIRHEVVEAEVIKKKMEEL